MFARKLNTATSMWHSTQGGESMSLKELNKMLEKLPEADIEKLELVAKGMQMAQKSQKNKKDEDEKSA